MTRALHRLIQIAAAAVFIFSASPAIARDKSDVITLANGDRITGEIIDLEYGQLTVKTESMGTIEIEWLDVARIDSPFSFSVEANDGNRYSGTIASGSESGHIMVTAATVTADLDVHNVSRLSQLEAGFVERLTGSVSLGFDATKSSGVSTLAFQFDTEYRSEKNVASLDANFTANDTAAAGTFNQYSLTYLHQFIRPGDRFWLALGSYESNEQQGIDGRLLLGGARGKYLVRRDVAEFSTFVGIAGTQEWATGSSGNVQSAEALLGLQWKIFRFKHPETSLTSQLMLLPSLTESGRYRANLGVSLRHEIVKDFYADLSLNSAYDSEPPTAGADEVDYSVSTSLGYKF
jgi:hypothetical protein